jgi:hypothetical protein
MLATEFVPSLSGLVGGSAERAMLPWSRVSCIAHYPHDIAAAVVVGVVVGLATALALRRYATPQIEKLSTGRLRPVLRPRPRMPDRHGRCDVHDDARRDTSPTMTTHTTNRSNNCADIDRPIRRLACL